MFTPSALAKMHSFSGMNEFIPALHLLTHTAFIHAPHFDSYVSFIHALHPVLFLSLVSCISYDTYPLA